MRHRPAVTLLEVLITIFIMAIGMLALLTLFPLGALNMARALQDDRVASAAANAEQLAIAFDIRHDPLVAPAFLMHAPNVPLWKDLTTNMTYTGPSHAVYVDPIGFVSDTNPVKSVGALAGTTPGLPRCTISLNSFVQPVTNPPPPMSSIAFLSDRWFTFPDDITFTGAGVPEPTAGVQRLGRYTIAYVLRRPQAQAESVVDVSVVIYAARPTQTPPSTMEWAYPVTGGLKDSTTVVLNYDPATQPKPNLRAGSWILDTSLDPTFGFVQGYFYRVTSTADTAPNQVSLELQTPLKANMSVAAVMENVAEVLDKGTGWQP